MDLQTKIDKAKTQLVLRHPFFASILLRHELMEDETVPTVGVNTLGRIRYNPEFLDRYEPDEILFIFAHECMHVVLLHLPRMGSRDPRLWNIAGDKVINDTLIYTGVGSFPKGGLTQDGARNKTTEELYEEEAANANANAANEDFWADLDPGDSELSEADKKEIEATVKVMVAQAAQAARMQGQMPEHLSRLVDEILAVRTPWYDILERHMTTLTKDDYSWAKPNRRHIHASHYLPSSGQTPHLGHIALVVDTSGSIGDVDMRVFQGHMNRIIEQCHPDRLTVIYCDDEVGSVDEYTLDDLPAKFKTPTGGGGTDMRVAFDYIADEDMTPDCVVCLSDGYTPFPENAPWPLIWLMTTDEVAPVGETVGYERDE